MELYKGKYFEVVFEDWCQEFPGACIVSGHKEKLINKKLSKIV